MLRRLCGCTTFFIRNEQVTYDPYRLKDLYHLQRLTVALDIISINLGKNNVCNENNC